MSHAQHWPELNSTAGRLKIFLTVFCCLILVSVTALWWRDTASRALLRNAALPSLPPDQPTASAPVLATTNSEPKDSAGEREADFLVFMADEMFRRGDTVGAAQAFQKAVEQNPTAETNRLKLALCYVRLNRMEEAISNLNEAIHIAPDFAEAHHQMGMALMKCGRFADAEDHLEELTRLRPSQASAFNGLGLALARQRKFEKAAHHFLTAARLNPRYLEAHYNLSQVYAELGATREAAAELDLALRINPEFEPARIARLQLAKVVAQ